MLVILTGSCLDRVKEFDQHGLKRKGKEKETFSRAFPNFSEVFIYFKFS
jgi:hypothetical protein